MPAHAVDPAALLAAVRTLAVLRDRAATAEDELAGLHVEAGEPASTLTIADGIDQVIDTVRALADLAEAQTVLLRNTAQAAESVERANRLDVESLR